MKLLALTLPLLLASCDLFRPTDFDQGRSTDGHLIPLPKCSPAIVYQAKGLSIKGVEWKGQSVGSLEWQTKFREVSPLIAVLDKQEVQSCKLLRTQVAVSRRAEVQKILSERQIASDKLAQLQIIAASQNTAALERWVKEYYRRVDPSFYEANKDDLNPDVVVAKTEGTEITYKLRDIDARPAAQIMGQ